MPTLPASAIVTLYRYARRRNAACDELAELVASLPDRLDERVPRARFIEAMEVAVRCTGDEDFGLHFAEEVRLEHLDLLGYLVASSRDLAAGMVQAERFFRLQDDGLEMRLVLDGDEARFVTDPGNALPRDRVGVIQHAIGLLVTNLCIGHQMTGVEFIPRSVSFAVPRPRDTAELERFFRTELRFDAPVSELTLSRDTLALPLLEADPSLGLVLERYAQEIMARRPKVPETWAEKVQQLLPASLVAGERELDRVAKQLGTSRRTLQRRLRDEGTSFQVLLDELRRELSIYHLREPARSASEVAYLLGFKEISAFYRSFKRWTGLTPAEFRRQS